MAKKCGKGRGMPIFDQIGNLNKTDYLTTKTDQKKTKKSENFAELTVPKLESLMFF